MDPKAEITGGRPVQPVPKVAFVTGGTKRIGGAIVRDLAQQGWRIALHSRAPDPAAGQLIADIIEAGGQAVHLVADLAKENEVQPLIGMAEEALGPVGLVVNNASRFEWDTAIDSTRADWDAHMETNLRAPFVLIQEMARRLPPTASGVAVNLIDQRVWNLTPYFPTYTLSKAGLWTLTQTLAMALAPRIRVNAIGPGPTLPSPRQDPAHFNAQCDSVPLQRGTSPQEICTALRFILEAPAMTGQMIALDGGQHLGWAQADPKDGPGE